MSAGTTSWNNLATRIRRNLGSGMIDVELTTDQINDAIQESLDEYRSIAGSSSKEGWMFFKLVPGQRIYSIPSYVNSVIKVERMDFTLFGGISGTQFASYIYNYMLTGEPFDLVSFYLARSFMETLQTISAGNIGFRFHSSLNGAQIGYPALGSDELAEVPDTRPTGTLNIDSTLASDRPTGELDFSNRLRLDGPVLEILTMPKSEENVLLNIDYSRSDAELINDMEVGPWVFKYARACAKITLGHAYRKFGQMPGPGGGLSLPGSDLITEGKEEQKELVQDLFDLRNGEDGYGIYMG